MKPLVLRWTLTPFSSHGHLQPHRQPHGIPTAPQAPTGVEWEDVSQKWKKHPLQASSYTLKEPGLRVQLGAKGKAKLILQIPLVLEEWKHVQESCHCLDSFWKSTGVKYMTLNKQVGIPQSWSWGCQTPMCSWPQNLL